MPTNHQEPALVYRVYDVDNRLIYIGATRDLMERMRVHEQLSWWFPLMVRVETEEPRPRFLAFATEALAIQEEQPAFNRRHTGRPDGDISHYTPTDLALHDRWVLSRSAA